MVLYSERDSEVPFWDAGLHSLNGPLLGMSRRLAGRGLTFRPPVRARCPNDQPYPYPYPRVFRNPRAEQAPLPSPWPAKLANQTPVPTAASIQARGFRQPATNPMVGMPVAPRPNPSNGHMSAVQAPTADASPSATASNTATSHSERKAAKRGAPA